MAGSVNEKYVVGDKWILGGDFNDIRDPEKKKEGELDLKQVVKG